MYSNPNIFLAYLLGALAIIFLYIISLHSDEKNLSYNIQRCCFYSKKLTTLQWVTENQLVTFPKVWTVDSLSISFTIVDTHYLLQT